MAKADYVIYLDDTLLGEGLETELKPGGVVLVNSVHVCSTTSASRRSMPTASRRPFWADRFRTHGVPRRAVGAVRSGERRERAEASASTSAKLHAKNIAIVDAAREAMGEAGAA